MSISGQQPVRRTSRCGRIPAWYRRRTGSTPHVPPSAGGAALAGWLTDRFGPVPMTLLSWIRLVGDVWLVGTQGPGKVLK